MEQGSAGRGIYVIDMDDVRTRLANVFDPELGLNIVEMGLVYDIAEPSEGNLVIQMTMTTPGCPMHDSLSTAVERAAMMAFGVASVQVDVVWNPPWTPALMTEEAKAKLGMS